MPNCQTVGQGQAQSRCQPTRSVRGQWRRPRRTFRRRPMPLRWVFHGRCIPGRQYIQFFRQACRPRRPPRLAPAIQADLEPRSLLPRTGCHARSRCWPIHRHKQQVRVRFRTRGPEILLVIRSSHYAVLRLPILRCGMAFNLPGKAALGKIRMGGKMVPPVRIELTASPLPRVRSTPELRRHPKGVAPCHWRAKRQLHVYRIGDITITWKRR